MHKCSVIGCENMQRDKLFAKCNFHLMESIKQAKKQEPQHNDDSWVHDSDMESRD